MTYGDAHVFRQHENAAPSVIGAEHVAPLDGGDQLPDQVFLPAERITDPNQPVTLELRVLSGGTTAMLAYTSLEALVAGCGEGQPWIAVEGNAVEDLQQRSEADAVLWDAAVPLEQRRGQGER
ncbi:hypothetical protein E1202_04485 [Saccharopolyspora karakumensis]|uniref:SseB protein N-terminal domain-containing protein n=1 Tax=Saccharopolyspora karakumensis TaxID=2530386 RepID=A0A4R5C549_9PSEU|nr:SAV_915 family protein [Saccharopolyspora karakumensis]TDD91992.1 hypothetical protein E1202_04485 [Saccharopolyspora karakumensis]